MPTEIKKSAIKRREYWVEEIRKLSGNFGDDSTRLEQELTKEIQKHGTSVLVDHLRLCGDIPESYHHDSSEEKLYSKYTDCVLAEAFRSLGMQSVVLKERADTADVEVVADGYSFVADAKSFRLSRTAKNQKDFKMQAMDGWKRGKSYAIVVCPIYQLPTSSSQIYQQATTRNVCIFTYSHLAMITKFASIEGTAKISTIFKNIFDSIPVLNPSKESTPYWHAVNRAMLDSSENMTQLWIHEKQAAVESIVIAKELALKYLAEEREKIMRMSHGEAIRELVRVHKIDSKEKKINAVRSNRILDVT